MNRDCVFVIRAFRFESIPEQMQLWCSRVWAQALVFYLGRVQSWVGAPQVLEFGGFSLLNRVCALWIGALRFESALVASEVLRAFSLLHRDITTSHRSFASSNRVLQIPHRVFHF